MYLYLSHDVNSAAFRIHFPSTLGQVQHEIAQMGGASPVQIVGTSSYADRLGNYIRFIKPGAKRPTSKNSISWPSKSTAWMSGVSVYFPGR